MVKSVTYQCYFCKRQVTEQLGAIALEAARMGIKRCPSCSRKRWAKFHRQYGVRTRQVADGARGGRGGRHA